MNIILYTTGCPQCKVLKAKLDAAGLSYETVTDQEIMAAKGFRSAPVLEVDGVAYTFTNAIAFFRGIQNGN